MDKSKLRKSNLHLKQSNETVILVMDIFERTFKTKKRFEMIHIMVVTCNKDQKI